MPTPDLTIRETAELAGVPKKTVEKAIEYGILEPDSVSASMPGRAKQFLPLRAVVYFLALKNADLTDLPVRFKKAVWENLNSRETLLPESIEFSRGTRLLVKRLAEERFETAARYKEARDKYIDTNSEILGGTPIIRGTRITVYSILGRVQDGETIDDLLEDNPDIPREAFEAAVMFAKTHPMRGRPGGRPWRNVA